MEKDPQEEESVVNHLIQEIIQTGPTSTPPPSSAPSTPPDSPTMGDEKVESNEQTLDDHDSKEVGAKKGGANPGTIINENEREEEEGLQRLQSGLTFNLTKEPEHITLVKPLSTIIEDEDDDDEDISPDDVITAVEKKPGGPQFRKSTKVALRMLPPMLSVSDFIDSVSPLPDYDYVMVDNPDPEWGPNGRTVAHINFLDHDDALWFIDRFTGFQFFDDYGESYIGIGDFAMSQHVFTSKRDNPDRGKIVETEFYKAFMEKYNQNPFQFDTGIVLEDVMTAEEMLADIESRKSKKGPESTPLTRFILGKKVRKENDRKQRREKDRERQRLEKMKRDKERERNREADRDKNDKRRERRDRERKERKFPEKVEKEAGNKGMTVTYSKNGGATRWSANSTPGFKKGKDDIQENEEATNNNAPSSSKDFAAEKSHPKPEERRKPTNPFSKDIRKFDKPREEKPKFGKPFPTKNETTYSSQVKNEKLDSSAPTIEKPIASSTTTKTSTKTPEEIQKQQVDSAEKGKKKIIKKIIRVKKVKPKTGEEGEGVETTKKPVASTSTSSSSSSKPFPKPVALSSSSSSSSTDRKPGGEMDDNMKRRRARPDMQIYRPGSLRTSKDTKDKPNNKPQEKSASSKPNELAAAAPEQEKT